MLILKAVEEIIKNEKRVIVNQDKILEVVKKNPHVTLDELSKKNRHFAQEHHRKCQEIKRSWHVKSVGG